MLENPDQPPILEYGAKPSGNRRRALIFLASLGIVTAIGVGVWCAASAMKPRHPAWLAMRNCLARVHTEDALMFEIQLLGNQSYEIKRRVESAPEWQAFSMVVEDQVGIGLRVHAMFSTAYLGEIRTPSGQRRLISISMSPGSPSYEALYVGLMFKSMVVTDRGPWSEPTVRSGGPPRLVDESIIHSGDLVRVHSAIRDPNDDSHLIIRMQVNDVRYEVDVRIDDQDRVTFVPRASPN